MFVRPNKETVETRMFSDDRITAQQSNTGGNRTAANSSKELSGHRPSSKKQFDAGIATPAPSQVTEISPGPVRNSFRALPRLRRAQTGRKKAPYPQIVYLLIRENNWVEFIISRVPAHRRASLFLFAFTESRFIRVDCTQPRFIPPISSSVLLNGRYILRRSDNVWKIQSVRKRASV